MEDLTNKIQRLQKVVDNREVTTVFTPTDADKRQRKLLNEILDDPGREELSEEWKQALTLLQARIP